MKIEWNFNTAVLNLPKSVLDALSMAGEGDLKVLLCLAGMTSEELLQFDPVSLSSVLNMSEKEVELSVAFWRGNGAIKTGRSPKIEKKKEEQGKPFLQDALPNYSGKEMESIMKERESLKLLLNECQKIVGKVFNVTESNKMIALSDYLHLDEDYILLLSSYCKSKGKGTVAYISKTAYELYNSDILTSGQLEEYIMENEKREEFQNKLRKLFGMGGRTLTQREKKFFLNFEKMEFPFELIAFAYEISVDATGDLSLPHLNAILENWKKSNVKTLEEAEKASNKKREELKKLYRPKVEKDSDKTDFESFDAEDFFSTASKKSLEKITK